MKTQTKQTTTIGLKSAVFRYHYNAIFAKGKAFGSRTLRLVGSTDLNEAAIVARQLTADGYGCSPYQIEVTDIQFERFE